LGIEEERFGMYTDDTNSTLALASSLVQKQCLDPEHIAKENAKFFYHEPRRGYSEHSQTTLEALHSNTISFMEAGDFLFEGGSWSNGSVMKIAPLGIAFRNATDDILQKAVKMALLSTHTHPEAVDSAWIQAKAVAVLAKTDIATFSPKDFLVTLTNCSSDDKVKRNLRVVASFLARELPNHSSTANSATSVPTTSITNSILNSVPEIGEYFQIRASDALACSLYAFLKYFDKPEQAIIEAVNMGGDTDTLGAITGALVGALHGAQWIPKIWYENLENGEFGRDYAISLAKNLSNLDQVKF